MKPLLLLLALAGFLLEAAAGEKISLFDGKTFQGWEGDTRKTWRIEEGAIVGGSLTTQVPRNEFLCTTRPFTNFVLRLKFKLEGTNGFVNAGVQVRSQRVPNHHEVSGYQADIGDGWWGALYDEARRNKVLIKPEAGFDQAVRRQDWNDYEIRCEGRRIRLFINGKQAIDYTEPDESIPQWGLIGLQIHGGGAGRVSYKEITIEEL
jgi:hypothetical protein